MTIKWIQIWIPFYDSSYGRTLIASSKAAIVGLMCIGLTESATTSCVLYPFPVMNATVVSQGLICPDSARRFRAVMTTPPAGSVNIPSFSASSLMPDAISSSETAHAPPLDSSMVLRA